MCPTIEDFRLTQPQDSCSGLWGKSAIRSAFLHDETRRSAKSNLLSNVNGCNQLLCFGSAGNHGLSSLLHGDAQGRYGDSWMSLSFDLLLNHLE